MTVLVRKALDPADGESDNASDSRTILAPVVLFIIFRPWFLSQEVNLLLSCGPEIGSGSNFLSEKIYERTIPGENLQIKENMI